MLCSRYFTTTTTQKSRWIIKKLFNDSQKCQKYFYCNNSDRHSHSFLISSTILNNYYTNTNSNNNISNNIVSCSGATLPSSFYFNRSFSVSQPTMELENMDGILRSTRDRYRGITVDTQLTEIPIDQFPELLEKSLEYWKSKHCRSIWFKINLKHSELVPILTKQNFDFHHARQGFVTLVRWLPTTETPNIPPYSHTMVGVGGLVINNQNQILSITEKQAIVKGSWKLPGGYVEPGENLVDAAIREVFEETGIQTKFVSLISIRHAHGFNFGCSDLYITMALTPIDSKQNIVNCDREIADSKWMDFDEYLNHPNVHELNRDFLRKYLEYKKNGIEINCTEAEHQLLKKKYNVYFVEKRTEPKL